MVTSVRMSRKRPGSATSGTGMKGRDCQQELASLQVSFTSLLLHFTAPQVPISSYIPEPESGNHSSQCPIQARTTSKPDRAEPLRLGQGAPKGGTSLLSIKPIKH